MRQQTCKSYFVSIPKELVFGSGIDVILADMKLVRKSEKLDRFFLTNPKAKYFISKDIPDEFGNSMSIAIKLNETKLRQVYLFDEFDKYISQMHGLDIALYKKLTDDIMSSEDAGMFIEYSLDDDMNRAVTILDKYRASIPAKEISISPNV